jgi:Domain of unknown function (DUF1844)
MLNFERQYTFEDDTLPDHNRQENSFRVIDRRPFTSEGELRKDVVEREEREAQREETKATAAPPPAPVQATPVDMPQRSPAFENLVRMLGSNAAMVLGAYADPRTGQPVVDPEAAREFIDMLDALREKTNGNLAPEEDSMLLDLLGKLKMTYLEINQAVTAQVTQQAKAKTRS